MVEGQLHRADSRPSGRTNPIPRYRRNRSVREASDTPSTSPPPSHPDPLSIKAMPPFAERGQVSLARFPVSLSPTRRKMKNSKVV